MSHGHERTYQIRFGLVTIRRRRGWCKRCKAWLIPADYALGLEETGSAWPSVQEMAALTASKLPIAEASPWAAAPSNQPAANTNAASNFPDNSGPAQEMKP